MIKLDSNLRKAMEKFLASPARNQWVSTPQMDVYVRKGMHMVGRHMYMFLDLASMTVRDEFQSQGLFKQTLELFKQLCGNTYQGVYMESVLNPRLAQHLRELSDAEPEYHWSEETQCCSWLKGKV
jgi:hypothetical protein